METILITFLLISILYLIFAMRDMRDDIADLEHRLELLTDVCKSNEVRIKYLENVREQDFKRRKSANKYRRLFEATISKCSIYCHNGWSVSKTLFSKTKGKAYRIFEGGFRPTYLRAKQNVLRTVYRA